MKQLITLICCVTLLCSCSFIQKDTPQITPLLGQTIYYHDATLKQWVPGVVTEEKFLYHVHHPDWTPEHVITVDGRERLASFVYFSKEHE